MYVSDNIWDTYYFAVVDLRFKFNWVFCFFPLNLATVPQGTSDRALETFLVVITRIVLAVVATSSGRPGQAP